MRVGLLWREGWDPVTTPSTVADTARLRGVFAAFAALGVSAEAVVYSDDRVDETRKHLLELDGVLVWVNPIEHGLDRSLLDPLLREVSAAGVFVSAHPDVIAIRAYLSHDCVVGCTHQYPRGLMPPGPDARPTSKLFEAANAPAYAGLRARLEHESVPALQSRFELATEELPVIWDADFLFGPKMRENEKNYVLCEINASSTFAFPEHAMARVAEAALARIGGRGRH